jgi:alpha-D-ribose 1-methylphosphonate 5-triphosphate synthase subunit PhnG
LIVTDAGFTRRHMSTAVDGEMVAAPTQQASHAARQHWLAILAGASAGQLETAWQGLTDKPAYRALRAPETGLIMLRGRVGGTGQPFNVGEMTMTRAAVQLLGSAGEVTHTGFGYVAGRSARRAELVALFDALLQDPARHDAITAAVVEPLAVRQQAAKARQSAKVAASKVDFFTMVRGE